MSTPYGMPSTPQPPTPPAPPAPPAKRRTGLYIGLACGCLLLVAVLIFAVGGGAWLLSRDGGEERPTGGPTTTDAPVDPTEDGQETESEEPVETPTEDPEEDPTSQSGTEFSISVSAPEEGTTLETDDQTLETENGKFIGVAVTITNTGDTEIGWSPSAFTFVDTAGVEHPLIYGSFSTSGPQIPAGVEATAVLYADVPTGMELESITYTDEAGTGGIPVTIPVD
ncbi:DUF4352 domain-containing protein [Brachybacterium saurashtrense]|uniref:DUF4352 domain-containing protein n=1 Tax=Brachybacterium saurashtrense TaxID=556288 RepID=A0A345YSP9_9MICO|nr:DUF4352 domain-containing protein [Brachybacterium saurashtrense]AXK46951.1 DUF4352 domain-containing protein [Brachybacterium saurashtrense]RRR22666.1 DUF4352 domain-containing protein [Brachybacterium saurashtrense]